MLLSAGLIHDEDAQADLVKLERFRGQALHCIDVHAVFERCDGCADGPGAELQQVPPPGKHLVFAHPDELGLELIGYLGR